MKHNLWTALLRGAVCVMATGWSRTPDIDISDDYLTQLESTDASVRAKGYAGLLEWRRGLGRQLLDCAQRIDEKETCGYTAIEAVEILGRIGYDEAIPFLLAHIDSARSLEWRGVGRVANHPCAFAVFRQHQSVFPAINH